MQITDRLAKETAREYAYRIIKQNIVNLDLEPGSRLSEVELAKELGLSRTPVREALIELSKSQIVEIYPQKGSYISKIDYSLVEEAWFLRDVLEKAVLELDCHKASQEEITILENNVKLQEFYLENPSYEKLMELDDEFHKELFMIAGKIQIYNLMNTMTAHFERVRIMSLKSVKEIKMVGDHRLILEAVKAHDAQKALELMEKHLSRFRIDEESIKEKYAQYFK